MLRELHRATVSHSCLRGVSTGWWRTYIYLLKATPKVPGHTSAECFLVFLQHRRTNSPSPLSQSVPIGIHFSLATQNNAVLSCQASPSGVEKTSTEMLAWAAAVKGLWLGEGQRGRERRGTTGELQAGTTQRGKNCKEGDNVQVSAVEKVLGRRHESIS